jgi:hypothetical protein
MILEERMFRQQQRDWGNPYKEGTRSWLAWSRGYTASQLACVIEEWNKRVPKEHRINLGRTQSRSTNG